MRESITMAVLKAIVETMKEDHPTAGQRLADRLDAPLQLAKSANWTDDITDIESLIQIAKR